ncbi:MAG: hypothetical protein RL268_853 [Pseudomonadota bacterium]|jgi:hypothetical protein
MLHLMKDGAVLAEVSPGASFSLPDGRVVMPAVSGWWNDDGFSLAEAPAPTDAELLLIERATDMKAYRLAFEDACEETAFGEGTLLDAIDALLAAADPMTRRRYANITIFERLRPEVAGFLQNPAGINLTDSEVDALFRLAKNKDTA